jgi:hypothetical protein
MFVRDNFHAGGATVFTAPAVSDTFAAWSYNDVPTPASTNPIP